MPSLRQNSLIPQRADEFAKGIDRAGSRRALTAAIRSHGRGMMRECFVDVAIVDLADALAAMGASRRAWTSTQRFVSGSRRCVKVSSRRWFEAILLTGWLVNAAFEAAWRAGSADGSCAEGAR